MENHSETAKKYRQKHKILYLLDILLKESDEDHPISAPDLIEMLVEKGIAAERKSIYADIGALTSYGYDIISTRIPKQGFFIASRDFELPEVRLLADAVTSAAFITTKKSNELIKKISNLASRNEWKEISRQIYLDKSKNHENEKIFYHIDFLQKAISKRKRISIKYIRHNMNQQGKIGLSGKNFERVSPYSLIWESDHYYLVCNNPKYDNLMHLRLDRIESLEILAEEVRPVSEVSAYLNQIDTADYVKKSFNMFGGEVEPITLRCPKTLIEEMYDRFGKDIKIFDVTENSFCFTTTAMISDGLVSLIFQFNGLEVLRPSSLRDKIKERIKDIYYLYCPRV